MIKKYIRILIPVVVVATGIQLYAMSPYQTKQAVSHIRNLLNTPLGQWDNQLVSKIDQDIRKLQPSDPAQARAFRAEFDNLKNQIQQVRAQVRQQPVGVPANAQAQLDAQAQQIANLQQQLAQAQQAAGVPAQVQEQLKNKDKEISDLREKTSNLQEQLNAKEQTVVVANRQVAIVNKKYDTLVNRAKKVKLVIAYMSSYLLKQITKAEKNNQPEQAELFTQANAHLLDLIEQQGLRDVKEKLLNPDIELF
jgi:chromosome segregation ATPase